MKALLIFVHFVFCFSAGFAALLIFLLRVVSGTAMQYAAKRFSFKPERRIPTAVAQAGKVGEFANSLLQIPTFCEEGLEPN